MFFEFFENHFSVYLSRYLQCRQRHCEGELIVSNGSETGARHFSFNRKYFVVDFEAALITAHANINERANRSKCIKVPYKDLC